LPVFIHDIGYTRVGDHWGKSIPELAFDASKDLLNDSIRPEALIVSSSFPEITSSQSNLGPLIADSLGLVGIESFRIESSGASGGAAIHLACEMLESGRVASVLVVGVEKMRDLDPARLVQSQGLSENADYTQFFGVSFASVNALLARLYMKEFGVSRIQLSAFPAIAHKNSFSAAHAQFKRKFTVDEISRSEIVSDPLRVLDCAPVGDGAAALLLTKETHRRKGVVKIESSETVSSRVNFFERSEMFRFPSTEEATKKALMRAGTKLGEIDFFEIHDTYSILAALIVEALGLSKIGNACREAEAGKFDLTGENPISTFGGMKGRGYPVGAAGIYQACEAVIQLTGRSGSNQLHGARKCLLQSMSGIDSSAYVHILSSGVGA
jgi:acetyl-CoA C-acetyltransferase